MPNISDRMTLATNLYIELLKKSVSNYIYDDDLDLQRAEKIVEPGSGRYISSGGAKAEPVGKFYGGIWPSRAHTMIGIPRLNNLQYCIEEIIKEQIPGDLIETGVWRGGATIFMRGVLKAHGVADRTVWVADSFEGLPPSDPARYPKESDIEFNRFADLAVSLEEVRENFTRYDLLDDQVRFLKGWFRDTLPAAPIQSLAVMRLDGDMYESTMDALVHLYAKLSPGGFAIIDDYNAVQSCNAAVDDFRRDNRITSTISPIAGAGAFWRKD